MMQEMGELTQFYNCKILRDHKIIVDDFWIRDKMIINPEPVFFDEKVTADKRVDCGGSLIIPGFIDLQMNGGFGHDFSTSTDIEKSINIVAKGILEHGVTSFCPTLITSSSESYHQILPHVKKRNGSKAGSGVLGAHLEGPFISKEKKGAHPVQYIKSFSNGFEDVLQTYGSLDNICLLTLAPELDTDGFIIKELVKRGVTVSLGHSESHLCGGELGFKQGASFITHLFNAMLPFHHRDPGLVGLLTSQKIPEDRTVFYGIISDGIHTHPAALRIAHRSNPEGLVLVTDAMSAMGLKPGSYCIGEQRVDVSEDRAVVSGTNTLSGSIATMNFCVKHLLKATGCSIVEAIECATLHPAQVVNITHSKGTLDFNTDADFVLLDDNMNVQSTYIAGECVWDRNENLSS